MRKRGLVHNVFVGLLVVLASVSFAATAIAGWTHQTALVQDRFVSVVTGATTDPAVIDSLGTRIADQVVDKLGIQNRLSAQLPGPLSRLAEPVTPAVHDRIEQAADKVLSSPEFQTFFATALGKLHTGFLNVVNGNSAYFTTTNGKLTLDLLAVMDAVVTQLQTDGVLPTAADFPRFSAAADRTDFIARLSTYFQTQLPADFGQIPIADQSSIDTIASVLHLFDQALIGLIVLSIVLAVLAIALADRRWNALAWLGFTTVFIFGLLIVALVGTQSFADNAVANPDNRVLLAALVRSLAESLAEWLTVIGVVTLFVAVPAAFLSHGQRKRQIEQAMGGTAA